MAKLFDSTLRQHGVTSAALADLVDLYSRCWSGAQTITPTRPRVRAVHLVGDRPADDVRAEWLKLRSEVLARHSLPETLPILERHALFRP